MTLTSSQPFSQCSRMHELRSEISQHRASGSSAGGDDRRTEYQRDLDRLLYTTYFLRLAEVTQVYAPRMQNGHRRGPLLHTRLTHSLKVGQIARRLAEHLNRSAGAEIDPDLVEAAGRAHDFGHPPFGHLGERVLDEFAARHGLTDGFEGNAQTFRVLATVANHPTEGASTSNSNGLDLTHGVLAACVKYPRPRGECGREYFKYGHYTCDSDAFNERVAPLLMEPGGPTTAASLMDWADDITYAVHDVEDFYRAGLIPLDRLAHRGSPPQPVNRGEANRFMGYARAKLTAFGAPMTSEIESHFTKYTTEFPRRAFDGDDNTAQAISAVSSRVITKAINTTEIRDGKLWIPEPTRGLISVLKQLTWFYVIDRPDLALKQHGQRRRLGSVTESLFAWSDRAFSDSRQRPWGETQELTDSEKDSRRQALPVPLRQFLERMIRSEGTSRGYAGREQSLARGVLDYVSQLSEDEVEDLYAVTTPQS